MTTAYAAQTSCLFLGEDGTVLKDATAQEGLPKDAKFASVYSCCSLGAAVTGEGQLHVWGEYAPCFFGQNMERGQLRQFTPRAVPASEFDGNVVQTVALGGYNACVIAGNRLYTCGCGLEYSLGYTMNPGRHLHFGQFCKMQHVPIKDGLAEVPIMDVVVGTQCSGAVGCDGTVWTWGPNRHGECGTGSRDKCMKPTRVLLIDATGENRLDAAFKARRIFMSKHTVVVGSDGTLNVWGNNLYGQLALGHDDMDGLECRLPVFIKTFPMQMAACGKRHTLFLTVSGSVFACGDNYCGALGLGVHPATPATYSYSPTSWYYETRVVGLPSDNVVSVSACGNQSMAVTSAGAVLRWGGETKRIVPDGGHYVQVTQAVGPELFEPRLFSLPMRVGLGHIMRSDVALALAMGLHARLGADSPVRVLCTDAVRRTTEAWTLQLPY